MLTGFDFPVLHFLRGALTINAVWTCLFAFFEKIRKENFILLFTDQKSRKLLLNIVNENPYPNVIVNKEGKIAFYNKNFEGVVTGMLN